MDGQDSTAASPIPSPSFVQARARKVCRGIPLLISGPCKTTKSRRDLHESLEIGNGKSCRCRDGGGVQRQIEDIFRITVQ